MYVRDYFFYNAQCIKSRKPADINLQVGQYYVAH